MTGSPAVIGFDRLATDQHALVGGKCASLGTMSRSASRFHLASR